MTETQLPPIQPPEGKPSRRAGSLQSTRHPLARIWSIPATRALVALVFVLLIGCLFNADGAFFKIGTHRDALRQASVFGILACGMTLVIISGGIDLAVGSVLAFAAVSFSLMSIHWGWSPVSWVSFFIACTIQPFIATLAMMVFARGLAKTVSGGMKVSTAVMKPDGGYTWVELPHIFRSIDNRILGGYVSMVSVIFLVCAVLAWIALSRHCWGRYVYAIGEAPPEEAAETVPVKLTKVVAYAASGMLAAVAGICQAAQEQQGDPEAGAGYELTAIAIVVIGGTSLTGGRGGMGLTLLGTLTIGYLDKVLSINAVPEASRLMLTGAIIVVAVLAQRRRRA